jgi:hypothetical protein
LVISILLELLLTEYEGEKRTSNMEYRLLNMGSVAGFSRTIIFVIFVGSCLEISFRTVFLSLSLDQERDLGAAEGLEVRVGAKLHQEHEHEHTQLRHVSPTENPLHYERPAVAHVAASTFEPLLKTKAMSNFKRKESVDVVVSHCTEDLVKLNTILSKMYVPCRNLYIYCKCGQPSNYFWNATFHGGAKHPEHTTEKGAATVVPVRVPSLKCEAVHIYGLPNVGREGHTWLTHMLRNEREEATMVVFLQGGTEVQTSAVTKAIQMLTKNPQYDFVDLSQYRFRWFAVKNCLIWKGCELVNLTRSEFCQIVDRYKRLPSTNSCGAALTTLRGEFVVRSDLITAAKTTTKLSELRDALSHENNPVLGHVLERTWVPILGANGLNILPRSVRQGLTFNFVVSICDTFPGWVKPYINAFSGAKALYVYPKCDTIPRLVGAGEHQAKYTNIPMPSKKQRLIKLQNANVIEVMKPNGHPFLHHILREEVNHISSEWTVFLTESHKETNLFQDTRLDIVPDDGPDFVDLYASSAGRQAPNSTNNADSAMLESCRRYKSPNFQGDCLSVPLTAKHEFMISQGLMQKIQKSPQNLRVLQRDMIRLQNNSESLALFLQSFWRAVLGSDTNFSPVAGLRSVKGLNL